MGTTRHEDLEREMMRPGTGGSGGNAQEFGLYEIERERNEQQQRHSHSMSGLHSNHHHLHEHNEHGKDRMRLEHAMPMRRGLSDPSTTLDFQFVNQQQTQSPGHSLNHGHSHSHGHSHGHGHGHSHGHMVSSHDQQHAPILGRKPPVKYRHGRGGFQQTANDIDDLFDPKHGGYDKERQNNNNNNNHGTENNNHRKRNENHNKNRDNNNNWEQQRQGETRFDEMQRGGSGGGVNYDPYNTHQSPYRPPLTSKRMHDSKHNSDYRGACVCVLFLFFLVEFLFYKCISFF